MDKFACRREAGQGNLFLEADTRHALLHAGTKIDLLTEPICFGDVKQPSSKKECGPPQLSLDCDAFGQTRDWHFSVSGDVLFQHEDNLIPAMGMGIRGLHSKLRSFANILCVTSNCTRLKIFRQLITYDHNSEVKTEWDIFPHQKRLCKNHCQGHFGGQTVGSDLITSFYSSPPPKNYALRVTACR